MRFLSIYKTPERSTPPSQEEMDRMGKLVEEGMKAGYLLGVDGCLPSAFGARVRQSAGKITVTDGPFAETKEVVGGMAILKANSKVEAIEIGEAILGGGRRWRMRASAVVRRAAEIVRASEWLPRACGNHWGETGGTLASKE